MSAKKTIEHFFEPEALWSEGMNELRRIVRGSGLAEEVKWGHPCYTHQGRNVVMVIPTKGHFGLWFWKGSLMKDPKKLLIQSDTKTQGLRQMRFTEVAAVRKAAPTIKAYLQEAALLEEQGAKVVMKKVGAQDMPLEWRVKAKAVPGLQKAFNTLTPGRQRAYMVLFGSAKQASTRTARINKFSNHILAGKGMDDK